jgi:hypothetical protein
MLVHDRGYLIAAGPAGTFTFYDPGGTVIPPSPALAQPDGTIDDCHDVDITPGTIIPPWYGERLDLDYAIYTCFANAEYHARQRDQAHQRDQAGQPDHPTTTATTPRDATAPQAEPWTPILTEVDIIAGIREQCQQHTLNGHR